MHDAVNMDASAPTSASVILSATIVIATKAFGAPGRLAVRHPCNHTACSNDHAKCLGTSQERSPKAQSLDFQFPNLDNTISGLHRLCSV